MKHTISVLVENKPGVLARIAGLFSARGFNIDSLAVGITEDPSFSRMTIVVDAADARILEQIMKQLRRLIDTISVSDLTRKDFVERELALVSLEHDSKKKAKFLKVASTYGAEIVAGSKHCSVVEICADSKKVKDFFAHLAEFNIKEVARTGKIAVLK